MSKKKKWLLIIGAALVVVIVIVLNLSMSTTKGTEVHAEMVTQRDLVEIVSASGRIQPQTKVNITSEVNGEIIALPAKEGDTVAAGQMLIVLDTLRLRSDLDQARFAVNEINARVEGAKVTLDQADEEFNRQKRLFENKLTSETQYNNSQYNFRNAKSSYEAMLASARQLQARYEKEIENFNKARITAPMAGIITYVDCEVGEIAAAQTAFTQGKTLMIISNLSVFEVEVEVDETEIGKIELHQPAKIAVDAFPDTTFAGEVIEIGNTAVLKGLGTQDQSTNFKVKVIFKDTGIKIRPGMSATVDITTHKKEKVLSVPYASIVVRSFDRDSLERAMREPKVEPENSGGVHAAETSGDSTLKSSSDGERKELKGVFVIKNGKVRFTEIGTGIADQKNIEITSGVAVGDSVVTGPYRVLRTIKEGDPVKPTGEGMMKEKQA
ncbi:MAG: efflux RND transporter periplasmic adaptor subunit [Candidatus Zixiibacteriota bacterium]